MYVHVLTIHNLVCPGNATRLISSDDLLSAETDTTDYGAFNNIITTLPFQQWIYWGSTGADLPSQGNMTFNDVFVITQFVTSGALVPKSRNAATVHYVSEFSFIYSNSINATNYKVYPKV